MKMLLFSRNEQYIATLRDVLSAKHTEELNGENVLEIETLNEIEKNQRLIYKDKYGYWHEFIVRGVEEERAEAGIIRKVFAEHSFYETWGDYIEDKRPYDVTANIALENALLTTRWEVGIVDDLGLNSTNFYHISAKEAVQKVAETWQGELRYRIEVSGNRITGRYVDLLTRRGYDLGKRFTYTKDLISITKTVHRDDVITALYGYGKGQEIVDEEGQPTGGYGRRITFGDINGGKNYVENLEAKEIWGRLNPDGTRSHVFGKVEFDDVEDPEELLRLTKEKLEELSKPLITYECKVIDLKAYGFEHEGVELGDWVGIVDKEFEPALLLKARVVKIIRDLLEPENTEITLGNFVPSITDAWLEQEKHISNFRDKQGIWDRSKIIDRDGTINAQFLNGLVAEMNRRMNAQGGYVYISDQGDGIITYDKPDPAEATMAIQILGGSFRIANSKGPDGSWQWRTFGDGNGFIADAFIGGLLKGGKVHFDLTNGTLLIGNSVEDYQLLWDGQTLSVKGALHIGPDTTFEAGYDPSEKETPEGAQAKADEAKAAAEQAAKGYAEQKAAEAEVASKAYTDAVEVGGRNLLRNSKGPWTNSYYGLRSFPFGDAIPAAGEIYTVTMKYTVGADRDRLTVYSSGGYRHLVTFYETDKNELGIASKTFTMRYADGRTPAEGFDYLSVYQFPSDGTSESTIEWIKLERGNKATDWTPAPEDVEAYTEQKAGEAEAVAKTYAEQKAQGAKDYASGLLASLADGTYSGGTFIDGTSIISPIVVGLQGTFAELMAGDPFGARLELGEAAGEPFLEAYDGADDLRVKLLQDRLQFFTQGVRGGEMRAITLLKESGNYHYLSISADGDLAMTSNGDLDIVSGHAVDIMAHDEDMHAWIEIEALYPIASRISLNANNISLKANAVWIDEGDLRLRDPAGSAGNTQIDFTGGYSLWRDDAGAGGNKTRLWLNTPHAGEVVVGPRTGADYLGRIRLRTLDLWIETGPGAYLYFWGPTDPRMEPSKNNIGYVGSASKAFKGMHAYTYSQASARDAKINLELADRASCYDQVRGLNFWEYNLKADVGNADADNGCEQEKNSESAAAAPVYLGVIADESPDIICDPEKKYINLYGYISLIGAALQEAQAKLEVLEDKLLERER